jgi:hypothetical protein
MPPHPPIPATWDWRDHAGIITPPLSQGACNACSSFAVSAAIDAAMAIAGQGPPGVDPGYIHTCVAHGGKSATADEDCQNGADLGEVLKAVQAQGCALSAAGSLYPFPIAQCAATATVDVLAGYAPIADAGAAKQAIAQTGPIVADMWVWQDFFRYNGATPTYVPDPDSGNRQLHSICIIGFDTNGWIIKNSLGPGWGKGGFATIPYGACGLLGPALAGQAFPCQAYSIELIPAAAAVPVS